MKTVAHKTIHNWWNGLVIIDEVREYVDARGSLTELWRTDDEIMCQEPYCPKMSYWSMTKPYIMRGPHQHSMAQCDWFYTFKNKMVYQLYNQETKEMRYYFTNPNAITRVKVAPPIIHSYRSLENKEIVTANFPSSLFMGENKKSPIDEVRWEANFDKVPVIFIFGANGRLGKALTKSFFDNMGFHQYEVIPCYEKLNSLEELETHFKYLETILKDRDVYFFNCAALTNVQDANTTFDKWEWANVHMPVHMANFCVANNWKFIGFSTDYYYQTETGNNYTKSKKIFEQTIKNCGEDKCISIVRVANLFSSDPSDVHNIIAKFKNGIIKNGNITIDPHLSVFPTDVSILSRALVQMFDAKLFTTNSIKYFNMIPKKYKLTEFVRTFFPNVKVNIKSSNITPWDDKFESDSNATIIPLEGNDSIISEVASRV